MKEATIIMSRRLTVSMLTASLNGQFKGKRINNGVFKNMYTIPKPFLKCQETKVFDNMENLRILYGLKLRRISKTFQTLKKGKIFEHVKNYKYQIFII
jgi:hypothetical protein